MTPLNNNPDALHIPYGGITLISPQFNIRVLDMWVYVGVFELAQWLLFLGLLAATFLALMIIGKTEKMENGMVKHITLGVETIFMYTLQLGSHPLGERLSKRLLFLTASLLTFLIFAYYTTNVTALMTFTRATIQ